MAFFAKSATIYKLNKFHFHLDDDQGWRIEIKKYPKLTEIGSYRKQTQIDTLIIIFHGVTMEKKREAIIRRKK